MKRGKEMELLRVSGRPTRGGFRLCEALGKHRLARPLLYKFV
jgi:hypothetical protein